MTTTNMYQYPKKFVDPCVANLKMIAYNPLRLPFLMMEIFFERSNAFGSNHHLVNIQKLIFTHFRTLFVYLTQKKIRSYLDDNDKASLQEKGHLPIIIILRPNNTQPRQTSFKN